MKIRKGHIGLLFAFFCCGCKTPPVQKVLSAQPEHNIQIDSNEKLQIYFPEFYNRKLKVYNGDGTVIILPDNKVIVIDGFKNEAAEQYIHFLHTLNITKIDYLVATHWHTDHIGSFPDIIENFEIGTFYSNGAPIVNEASKFVKKALEKYNIKHVVLKQGDELDFTPDVHASILWPHLSDSDKNVLIFNPGKSEGKINMSSLVTRITYKDFSIIFPGDIYKKGEKELIQTYGSKLKSTILKAAHHGEWYTANLPEFVNTVSPDYGIIQDNRYITKRISSIYQKAGSKVLYRLTPGYILIETDGNAYNITEKSY